MILFFDERLELQESHMSARCVEESTFSFILQDRVLVTLAIAFGVQVFKYWCMKKGILLNSDQGRGVCLLKMHLMPRSE